MTVSARLRRLMNRHHVTTSEIADVAGMHRQQVHAIVNGDRPNPGILTVERIVLAMGATMEELYDEE